MGDKTNISWTAYRDANGELVPGKTYNAWVGCTKVSAGCQFCYAEVWAKQEGTVWGVGRPRRRTGVSNRNKPLRWNREVAPQVGVRPRVFSASLSDWLDPEVPTEWLFEMLSLVIRTPNLDWLLLTKRPELWKSRIQAVIADWGNCDPGDICDHLNEWLRGNPPPNVWIGTSVEDQKRAEERLPALLAIPAVVRFLSCEPLLEQLDLARWLGERWSDSCRCPVGPLDRDVVYDNNATPRCPVCDVALGGVPKQAINLVIVGGESGDQARPFDLAWARSLRDQCKKAGTAFFFKQAGSNPVRQRNCDIPACNCGSTHDESIPMQDSAGGDPLEWPADLRVQELSPNL